MLHIGKLIDAKRRERRMTQQELADKMGRYVTGVVRLMKENESMDTATLLEFCVALEYNFFKDLMREAEGRIRSLEFEV